MQELFRRVVLSPTGQDWPPTSAVLEVSPESSEILLAGMGDRSPQWVWGPEMERKGGRPGANSLLPLGP